MKKLLLLLLTLILVSCGDDKTKEDPIVKTCNPVCDEWETCVETTCELKEGRCNVAYGCDIEGTICNLQTHLCDFDIPINWGSCPSYITTAQECATVMMPYNYDDLNSKRLPVFVFRYKTNSTNKKGQIWFLQGGPGVSGFVFDQYFNFLKNFYPDWDMYSLDHRGVGNSEKLTCSNESDLGTIDTTSADISKCVDELTAKYGENIKTFSTTGASKDVGNLIELLKEDGKKVFVYGGSYGTYWTQRYLQLFPSQADGIILDSIVVSGYTFFNEFDKLSNKVGKQFMEICQNDSACLDKMKTFAPTPWEAIGSVFNKLENGEICAALDYFTFDDLNIVLYYLLTSAYTKNLIPAFIYRLNRCNEDDKAVISTFMDNLFGVKKGDYVPESQLNSMIILYNNITINELWKDTDVQEAIDLNKTYYFSTNGVVGTAVLGNSKLWPTYEEPLLNKYSESEIPILMMNGEFDNQSPLETAIPAKDIYIKPYQTFVTFPYAAHAVTSQAITQDTLEGKPTCGEEIMFDFINNPKATINTDCFADLIPIEFGNSVFNQTMSSYYFGTTDMWEGGLQKTVKKENKVIENALRINKIKNYKLFKRIQERLTK